MNNILNLVIINNIEDTKFCNIWVNGNSLLVYWLLKPVLINENFAKCYNINSSNNTIKENSNFIEVIKYIINLDNKSYK